jgi:RimJ/RimL family protein N-acetyltransferase
MSTPRPILRPAVEADLPAIVAMRNRLNALELAGSPHAPIQRLSEEDFAALWGHTLQSPQHCWRVLEADGRPVGFGLIYLITPAPQTPGAFLHWAYLEEEYRRQGHGQALLEALLAWARERGVQRVELRYIEGNEFAARFWQKTGFRTFARQCVLWLEPRG